MARGERNGESNITPPLVASGGTVRGGGITDTFTNDRHFRAAGFNTLF